MSFIKSLIFGSEGSYNILGIPVEFTKKQAASASAQEDATETNWRSRWAVKCVNSQAFRVVAQVYSHQFMHEMGHALAMKLAIGVCPKVTLRQERDCVKGRLSYTQGDRSIRKRANAWRQTVVDLAGPMSTIGFGSCQLAAATRLYRTPLWPAALILAGTSVGAMSIQLIETAISANIQSKYSDFGQIARRGPAHLALASAALVGQTALGVCAAMRLAK